MLIGKAITGGYMTFSAVATNERTAEMISCSQSGVMMHGPTFMGNPLACAVSIASTRLLLSQPWEKRVKEYVDLASFQKRCVEAGVWIRPFGKNAYIYPPYLAISDTQLIKLCDTLLELIKPQNEAAH